MAEEVMNNTILIYFTEPLGIVNLSPVLSTPSGTSIENALWVPLLPDLQQSGIVGTPVCSLPVRLLQVSLRNELEMTPYR
jgi:hypothetical protein